MLARNNKCAAMCGGAEKIMNQQDFVIEGIKNAIRRNKHSKVLKTIVDIDDYKKIVEHLFNTNFEDYKPWGSGINIFIAPDIFKILYPMIPEDKKFKITMNYHLCNPMNKSHGGSFSRGRDSLIDIVEAIYKRDLTM